MKFTKAFKKEVRPSLKMAIHKRLAGWEDARSHKTLHASDLTKEDRQFCPREFALLDATKMKKKGEFIGTALMCTFHLGEAMHDLLRENWGLNESVGTWECLRCGARHKFQKKPKVCTMEASPGTKCGGKHFKYHEETFRSLSTGAVGNMDMILDLGEPKFRACEIKSIKADDFKTLVAPLSEHRLRTNLYMRMIEDSDHPQKHKINTQEALVFYICKGFGNKDESIAEAGIKDSGFSPFKEFWVQRDDTATEEAWKLAMSLHKFRQGGKMPQGICPNGLIKRAQICSAVKPCWSGQYPAGV